MSSGSILPPFGPGRNRQGPTGPRPAPPGQSRLDEASRHAPLDRLGVSPRRGFASSVGGNPITLDTQRRKLALVVAAARAVRGTKPETRTVEAFFRTTTRPGGECRSSAMPGMHL